MSSSQVGILVSRWTAGNQNGFKKHKYKAVYHKSQYMNGSGVKVFIKLQILISNYVSLTYAFSNFLKMSLRNKYRKNLASTSTGKVKMLQDNTYVEENSWEPLDCKEIKPVNPKGNQSWIVIGRTDNEAPILWPPEVTSWLSREDPDAGKDWGWEEKGTTEDEMLDGITYSMDMGLGGLWGLVMDREAWSVVVHRVTKSRTRLSNWTELICKIRHNIDLLILLYCYRYLSFRDDVW